ncbi:ABC transporter substrate-binding protein [Salinisphaera shabanensis]|uniref:ABC transporter substrate-binding protein n=1 Tax=Salinisphaera shabanensis TaxID=180542 RepID=UPI003341590E
MHRLNGLRLAACALLVLATSACNGPWNNPYPDADSDSDIYYSSFREPPRHLDPARSYATDEASFTGAIYEPPLQYHYLKRPYTLIPATATEVPEPQYLDADGNTLPDDMPAEDVATSVYTVDIRPGIRYQPHPAFAKNADGNPRYDNLTLSDMVGITRPADFEHQGTRELRAGDYVHEIKRLASPEVNSPIFGLMSAHIVGLGELRERLEAARGKLAPGESLDLTAFDFEGARVIDAHRYEIRVEGVYPQLRYWLALAFFAPVPPEVTRFYDQPALKSRNITLDTFPVGTGAYMLTENNPNQRMVLEANPNFHGQHYPSEGEAGDRAAGLLADAGKPLPFIKRAVYSREQESIPYWNKFLQGYYDVSGISDDAFGQAINIDAEGNPSLTDTMTNHGMDLATTVLPGIFYLGFNLNDDVVGGLDDSGRKLRQAISIAIDMESYIPLFLNGRGIVAEGPIPPGLFGYQDGQDGMNPVVYDWVDGQAVRKPIEAARALLAEAGYPNGIDPNTGQSLLVNIDTPATGPEFKTQMDWMRQQFDKLGIQLVVRATTWPRFQKKIAEGNVQIYFGSGWMADYPDPENFLSQLYGPNGTAEHSGSNYANYSNDEYDRLFRQMRVMENSPERQAIIERMLTILRRDAPWQWGYFPRQYALYHQWLHNTKPNGMIQSSLKYLRLDGALRAEKRREWNQPVLWPVAAGVALLVVLLLPAVWIYRRREHSALRRRPR